MMRRAIMASAAQSPVDVIDPEDANSYLTFTGDLPFTLELPSMGDGVIQYSHNATDWNEWNGNTINSVNNQVFLRGIGGTVINSTLQISWDGEIRPAVSCTGNIMTLLDYISPDDVVMGSDCFYGLFEDNLALISAPELPATTLADSCYFHMFYGTSITNPPELPATTLADYCYRAIFSGTPITTAPELPATTLAKYCYQMMFENCPSFVNPPELPATTLDDRCYSYMFAGTPITTAPELPATTLANNCYQRMFYNCSNIKISNSKGGSYQTPWRIPSEGIAVTASAWSDGMLVGTGGTFTDHPDINTTYYQVG